MQQCKIIKKDDFWNFYKQVKPGLIRAKSASTLNCTLCATRLGFMGIRWKQKRAPFVQRKTTKHSKKIVSALQWMQWKPWLKRQKFKILWSWSWFPLQEKYQDFWEMHLKETQVHNNSVTRSRPPHKLNHSNWKSWWENHCATLLPDIPPPV